MFSEKVSSKRLRGCSFPETSRANVWHSSGELVGQNLAKMLSAVDQDVFDGYRNKAAVTEEKNVG